MRTSSDLSIRFLSKPSILFSGKEEICEQPERHCQATQWPWESNLIECQELIPDTTDDFEQVSDAHREQEMKVAEEVHYKLTHLWQ